MEHARPPQELNMEGGPVSRADAWKRWRQQFNLFVKASGVKSESSGVQASLLVNLIGPEGFDVYQTFSFENDKDKDDVNVIIKKFDKYFGAKINITLVRYKFFTRNQDDGESIQTYVTALRLLSKDCEFGTLQEELIKDRIVCGVRNPTVRDRLLRCEDLDLDKAIKLCQAEEVSQESGRQLCVNSECSSAAHVHGVERRARPERRGGGGGPSAGWRGRRAGGARPPAPLRECAGCGGSGARCSTRCLPGKYHIVVDQSVPPVICASRKIPLSLKDRLLEELRKMEQLGVIRKVTHPTQWVHPLVIVAKKDGGIRVCLDPRELNVAVQRAHYQLPTLAELAARLHGAAYFSVLDANSGFWVVQLDDESADLCTFATPFGRYQFLRLPFGINCASEVFHGKMRQLLEDLDGVDNFIDDIIVWGKTRSEHDERLGMLLERARTINLKFNKAKCRIGLKEVTYLGHIFDANGMRPDDNKVRAIKEMPPPNDRKSLERFLGAVNYLSKFIPNYSQRAIPLTNLLKKENSWRWEHSEQKAFAELKEAVGGADVLALYDVAAPALLSVDASRDALGAVLLQGGRPVEFASRTLTDAQRRYAQVEKELLAIVFACERFHQYIFGKEKVIVESDHKPLESIFKKPLMSVPARLQRMMLRLQHYDLVVQYKPGKYMYIADTLSRAPLPDLYSEEVHKNNLYQIQLIVNSLPMSNDKLSMIKKETKRDSECRDEVVCIEGKARTRATVVGKAATPRSYVIQNKVGGKLRRNRRHLIKCEPPISAALAPSSSQEQSDMVSDEFKDACDNVKRSIHYPALQSALASATKCRIMNVVATCKRCCNASYETPYVSPTQDSV
ncbi:uncharacterized protein LOC113234842 [Hyposmocoma kahamanoa]|uniref:uncharacterized protein LOC113234842 n=1 Tax=Hyposmocoma kahamanoa TaxID=1477025 RepID=UPI000E6D5C97|nr:uncharacterized protein LOC113234842 [Hyposmocoma kahamanoa]